MTYELLGTHKASPEWYTPSHVWERIYYGGYTLRKYK